MYDNCAFCMEPNIFLDDNTKHVLRMEPRTLGMGGSKVNNGDKYRCLSVTMCQWHSGLGNQKAYKSSLYINDIKDQKTNAKYHILLETVGMRNLCTPSLVQEGEHPNRLDPKNPVYAEETSPSAIVNGFSERPRASHIQRIWPHSENLIILTSLLTKFNFFFLKTKKIKTNKPKP
ncbi:hypothetical protein U0070_019303, partial [Myodes glareolus]